MFLKSSGEECHKKGESMGSKVYQIIQPRIIRFGVGALNTLADEANKLGAKGFLLLPTLESISLA
ncbi:unnamed protein product [marine sediment metagenome]|uniref:Alcohol dehydrogenase iron-type/glycerol dehydrogenase GldA domain-containing protein n=1 Tax=marine sediment metagenome TaxID=412755 RepID=X1SLT5_9ZZZZ